MIVHFEEIKQSRKISGTCEVCEKRRVRTIVVSQTVNPWNRKQDGTAKNRYEVVQSVLANLKEKIEKLKQNFICATCWKLLPYPKEWPKKV